MKCDYCGKKFKTDDFAMEYKDNYSQPNVMPEIDITIVKIDESKELSGSLACFPLCKEYKKKLGII